MLSRNNKIKSEIIEALLSDGFKVIDKKDFVVATKQENTLYIHSLERIHTELNLKYLVERSSLKKIGGVAVDDLRELFKEAETKKLSDSLGFVSGKLNWSVTYRDSIVFNNKRIEFTELITDRNETITLAFLDPDRRDKFFSIEMPYRKFLKLIDSLQYKELKSFAPKFYQLLSQSV